MAGDSTKLSPQSVALEEEAAKGSAMVTEDMERLQSELEDRWEESVAPEEAPAEASAPVLLRAAAAEAGNGGQAKKEEVQELLQQASSKGQASFQLEHLLQKAAQYTSFIVSNIEQSEEQQQAATLAQQENQGENARSGGRRGKGAKKRKRGSEEARGDIHDRAESMKAGRHSNLTIEQPRNMVGGTLKPYQLEGLRWLVTLWQNGMSGILADEMGLGKTIQVIALLAHMREKQVRGNFLITAPLATLPNWINEIRKWIPDVPVLLYHGMPEERARLRRTRMGKDVVNTMSFPVVVTSYEIAIIDRPKLDGIPWKYLIVDEGQRIKNKDCRLVRELKRLRTENRLLLSGTPIQNSLEELWSLLNFVNPMIFDDLTVFQSWFGFRNIGKRKSGDATSVEDILDEEENDRIVTKLHEILRPFLLRRLKRDVLKDLVPPKREIILYCGMSTLQQEYYALAKDRRLRDALLEMGLDEAKELTQGRNPMIFRRICVHPFLFGEPRDPRTMEYIGIQNPKLLINASGKLRTLDRLLNKIQSRPALNGGRQRVLIFSQFTSMMDILEDYLLYRSRTSGWGGYCRLDGATKVEDRAEAIAAFNAPDSDKFAFLLSTRAGGLGINLATANTVVLFDSDWNPQMDSQAQDRAHRIGQKNPVTVYRLLTVGSIEIDLMEAAVSKKKLERLSILGGDFGRAGRRSKGDLTLDKIKRLLEDDVKTLTKRGDDDDGGANVEVTDAELDALMDTQRLFAGESWRGLEDGHAPLPEQGNMYDIVQADTKTFLEDLS